MRSLLAIKLKPENEAYVCIRAGFLIPSPRVTQTHPSSHRQQRNTMILQPALVKQSERVEGGEEEEGSACSL